MGIAYVGLIVGLSLYWWHPELHPRLSLGAIRPPATATVSPNPSSATPSDTAKPQALGAATTPAVPAGSTTKPGPTNGTAAANLIWADEFSGPSGSSPDAARWNLDYGGGGWGNGEWQFYTRSTANAAQDGAGHLVITARREPAPGRCSYGPCDITSARLHTDGLFNPTYGRFEARIKTPAGLGYWPAFWLYATDDNGEIDIMETNGRDPYTVSSTAHIPGYTAPAGLSAELGLAAGNSTADTFHIYAVEWTPTSITWSVDGRAYHTVKQGSTNGAPWVFNHSFYIIINLAVGSEDPGYPDATTPFPGQMTVDYVRAYSLN